MYANKTYLLYVSIFAFCPCQGLQQTILFNEQVTRGEKMVKQFVNLLKIIRLEVHYDYVLIVKDVTKKRACIFEDAIAEVNEPIMLLSTLNEPYLLQLHHSNNFLLLACSLEYLKQLNISNTVYQYVPHLIWHQRDIGAELSEDMRKFCLLIHKHGYFPNLIVTPKFLDSNELYLTCNFQKSLQAVSYKLFLKPFLDMQQLPIVTESDQLPPRTILFYDEHGKLTLTGFIGNHLTTFAKRYNANLVIVPPAVIGVTVHYSYLKNKTIQGLLDVASAAVPFKIEAFSEMFSYPVELMEYCFMIPLPHVRPAYHVYFDIIDTGAVLIILCCFFLYSIFLNIGQSGNLKSLTVGNIMLNDKIVRGLLGQSFVMPRKTSLFMKYICFLLCYSSIVFSTTYQAYLQSHLVHPSLEKRMETYEDIRRNNLKILLQDHDADFINSNTWKQYHDIFVRIKDLNVILKLRDRMDTSYVYPVSLTRWSVFNERQKLFERKLFYYSSQLCLSNLVLLSFPVRPGLPYMTLFNQHLLDVRDTGLLDHWLEVNFLLMVRLKLSSFKDLSVPNKYRDALVLKDLLWIWIIYGACNLLSLLVFVGEIIVYKIVNFKN